MALLPLRTFKVSLYYGIDNSLQAIDFIKTETPHEAASRFLRAFFKKEMIEPLRIEGPGLYSCDSNGVSGQRVYIREMD
jgi:hypothetical protein